MAIETAPQSAAQQAFEANYYPPDGTPWPPLTYRGLPVQQVATDLWALGELVQELRPGLIIETGTGAGGTALFLADLLTHVEPTLPIIPCVYTIGTAPVAPLVEHDDYVRFLHGASTQGRIMAQVMQAAQRVTAAGCPVLVTLDSAHDRATVLAELRAYGLLVTPGSYCVVQDTNLGATVMPEHGPGPAVAIQQFLAEYPGAFAVDLGRQPPITCHPAGWLRRAG